MIAAECGSFREAALLLALSPSALSRRIGTLEAYLGASMFERRKDGLALTAAGATYFEAVRDPIQRIRRSTESARIQAGPRTVRVMASHSILVGWLAPQVHQFTAMHRDIELELLVGRTAYEFKRDGADILFHSGPQNLDGLTVTKILDIDVIAVAAPMLATGAEAPQSIEAFPGVPRIAVKDRENLWLKWWKTTDSIALLPGEAKEYQTISIALEATAGGAGLSLGLAPHVNKFLRSGALVQCTKHIAEFKRYYGVAYEEDALRKSHDLKAVRDWLVATGRAANNEFRELVRN